LALTADDPLVGREIRSAHWATSVELVGADADLGTQAILAAIAEASRAIDHHIGRVDCDDELLHGGTPFCGKVCLIYFL